MRIHLLLMIAIIQVFQVSTNELGSRHLGDYLIHTAIGDYQGTIDYNRGSLTNIRPEVISYIITSPFQDAYISNLLGGVGYTYIYHDTPKILPALTEIYGEAPKETLTVGSLSIDDKLMRMETFTKKAQPNKIIVINFKYSKVNSAATINWLSLKDNKDDDPASVKVVKGGVGFKAVNLQMESRVGEALNITLQLYGRNVTVDNWPWYVSNGASTDALLFKVFWVWDELSLSPAKKNCDCKSGRLMTPREINVVIAS